MRSTYAPTAHVSFAPGTGHSAPGTPPAYDPEIANLFAELRRYLGLPIPQIAHHIASHPNVIAALEAGASICCRAGAKPPASSRPTSVSHDWIPAPHSSALPCSWASQDMPHRSHRVPPRMLRLPMKRHHPWPASWAALPKPLPARESEADRAGPPRRMGCTSHRNSELSEGIAMEGPRAGAVGYRRCAGTDRHWLGRAIRRPASVRRRHFSADIRPLAQNQRPRRRMSGSSSATA